MLIRGASLALALSLSVPCVAAGQVAVTNCAACDAPSAVVTRDLQLAALPPQASSPGTVPATTQAPKDQNFDLSVGQWIRRFGDDQWNIWSGPFRTKSAIKWDLLFAAGTGALIPADRHITDSLARNLSRNDLNVSREISNVGSYTTIGSVGALWIVGAATDNAHARETGILGVESVANAAAVWAVTNTLTRRERPLEGTGRGRFWVNNGLKSSMPSAHSTLTWAAASTIAHEYPKPWVEGLAYGAATAVSVTRVTGLRHFPSDSFVGAFFGYFIGREIFKLHCSPGMSAACHESHSRNDEATPANGSPSAVAATDGKHAPWLVRAKNFVKSTLD